MSLLSVLTVIFVVLKLVGVVTWSWGLCFAPFLLHIALIIVLVILNDH